MMCLSNSHDEQSMRLLQYQDSSMIVVLVEGRRIRRVTRVKWASVRAVMHADVSFELTRVIR